LLKTEIKDCTILNFPIKAFYSEKENENYVFYRQGHGFIINSADISQSMC